MSELDLDFYGCRVRLQGDPGALCELRCDFAAFGRVPTACGGGTSSRYRSVDCDEIELIRAIPPPGFDTGWTLWSGRNFTVRAAAGERRVLYRDGAAAAFDFSTHPPCARGRLYCAEPNRLRELGYLAVLSRAGEALDAKGLHRVHALGFEWGGSAGLLFLPSGGGKSELALELLRSTSAGLLSDDTPLVDSTGMAHSFPLRLGFLASADLSDVPQRWVRPFVRRDYAPKRVVDYDFFRERVRSGLPTRWLIVGRKGDSSPRFKPVGPMAVASALGVGLVIGHGVAQMAEYRLRPADAAGLMLSALARVRAARALLDRAGLWEFTLGCDPRRGAGALIAFLSSFDNISVIPCQRK